MRIRRQNRVKLQPKTIRATEKKLKRLKLLLKCPRRLRVNRKQVVKKKATDHPEIASKLKKVEVKTPG